MRNTFFISAVIAILIAGFIFLTAKQQSALQPTPTSTQPDIPQTRVLAENLDTPWAIAFLPDKSMLVTERPGKVRLISSNGQLESEPVLVLDQAKEISEGGLLGIAIDPQFTTNNFVYLYYTYYGGNNKTQNRVSQFIYKNKKLTDEVVVVENIPGAPNHNGGRIKFGPDNNLYVTTGDAQNPPQAQDTNTLGGKILRVNTDGKVEVYSYGHRNVQGLAWDSKGQLWATEHGSSALDEINKILQGKNYGWPIIQGDERKEGMETPALNSGSDTWAPAGAAFFNSSLFFGGLRGQALYEAVINGEQISLKEHFKGQFGRIREVILGPDEMIYITTSNRDGRGKPDDKDDKVIKINPQKL